NVIVEARVEERTRELRVTEERFRLLSSASPIGIVLTDASGNCLYVNRRWEDLSGLLHDACLDQGWLDCVHPEDKKEMLEKWMASIGESNEHVTEFRVEQEDKPISWLHSRVTSIGDSEGISRGYIWTFEDITERKNAEANLLMQYAITDALAESSDLSDASPKLLKAICTNRQWSLAILWMLDPQDDVLRYEGSWCADVPDLKQLVENSRRMTFGRGEGALGIPLVSGQPFIAQTPEESSLQGRMENPPERFGYMSFPVTEDEQVFGVLEFMSDEPIKPDGEFFLMLNSVATQINQFAEQMSAEMRLKDSDARIRAMLESAIDGIVTFDLSGIVELVNPSFERILGINADDVLGKSIAQIVPGETSVDRIGDRKISTIQDVLDDLKAHNYSDRELIVKRSDGTLIPVEFRVSEVVLGTRNFYSGIIRDITERKEVELRVSEFYSTVSHELRTPLTSIRGALGLMEGGIVGEIPAAALELVTIARVSCDRLIRLINDILDLRKIEAGKLELKLESLDSESMVKATADSLRTMCEEYGVSIEVHVNDKRPVKGDHDRVVQILTNLVSNAVKFSGPEGKLDVRVVGGTNGAVRFEVEDNGPGIPESQLHRLFGKFQQLDSSDTRAQGGTGLGLAISKALVEKHNGRIGVKSVEKKGSTFWFEIPADGGISN
ncbi:MAG: PAS domain S-box protein, partial [Candidatus Obscuribacterales bacterium]|nr:PAS domain S-box protein [Candidatus Obscuribacterales bacterium]